MSLDIIEQIAQWLSERGVEFKCFEPKNSFDEKPNCCYILGQYNSVEEIYIRNTELTELPDLIFYLIYTKVFDFSNNKIEKLPKKPSDIIEKTEVPNPFSQDIPKFIFSSESEHNIKSTATETQYINNTTYKLNLSNNKLTEFPDDFAHWRPIEEINLSENEIKDFPRNIITSKIWKIKCANIGITELPDFSAAEKLYHLDVSNNKIAKLPNIKKEIFRYVLHLNLSNNRIRTLSENFFSKIVGDGRENIVYNFNDNKIRIIPYNILTQIHLIISTEQREEEFEERDNIYDTVLKIIRNPIIYPKLSDIQRETRSKLEQIYPKPYLENAEDVVEGEDVKTKFPYDCIKEFKIQDFQGIKEIHIKDIPSDTRWIFLTGENGFGKTSILRGIVINLFGLKDETSILDVKEKFSGKIGYFIDNQYFNNFTRCNESTLFQKYEDFAAYGASRLNKYFKPENIGRTYSLFKTDGVLLDIEQKMIDWEFSDKDKKLHFASKQILITLLSPQVEDIKVNRDTPNYIVEYKETDADIADSWKSFDSLASGYRSIISMIGDMMIRLSKTQPKIDDFSELAGIVIIDEFDLHLHPKWQKMLVEKLTTLFPHIQFIVSTHSPIPLLGAPKNSIVIKVDRDKEHGITAEKLDIDFTTLTPNSILTSPIFGFENLVSVSKSEDKNLNTEDYFNDIIEKDKSLKEISEYLDEDKTKRIIELLNS